MSAFWDICLYIDRIPYISQKCDGLTFCTHWPLIVVFQKFMDDCEQVLDSLGEEMKARVLQFLLKLKECSRLHCDTNRSAIQKNISRICQDQSRLQEVRSRIESLMQENDPFRFIEVRWFACLWPIKHKHFLIYIWKFTLCVLVSFSNHLILYFFRHTRQQENSYVVPNNFNRMFRNGKHFFSWESLSPSLQLHVPFLTPTHYWVFFIVLRQ